MPLHLTALASGIVCALLAGFCCRHAPAAEKQRNPVQVGVDAAVKAAAEEWAATLQTFAQEWDPRIDPREQALTAVEAGVQAARRRAARVAELNGVQVDPQRDVQFGRWIAAADGPPPHRIVWGETPYNAVRVIARRGERAAQRDGDKTPAKLVSLRAGNRDGDIHASAIAVFDPRDIVLVMDYSASMNDDSEFKALRRLGREELETNMRAVFEALGPPEIGGMTFAPQPLRLSEAAGGKTVTVEFRGPSAVVESTARIERVQLHFTNGGTQSFRGKFGPAVTLAGRETFSGMTITGVSVTAVAAGEPAVELRFDDRPELVLRQFHLHEVKWPWPSGSWREFVQHCRTNRDIREAGYAHHYGGLCLVDYLLDRKSLPSQCPDLWKTPHYPLHACKNGITAYLKFLDGLGWGDRVALADSVQRHPPHAVNSPRDSGAEGEQHSNGRRSADPFCSADFRKLEQVQRRRQAGQFGFTTATGFGIRAARESMVHARKWAGRQLLLISDGHTNRSPSGWTLPGDWNWDTATDFDGDGRADYQTGDVHQQYTLWEVKQAAEAGVKVHALAVGSDADREFLRAVAGVGGGRWREIPADAKLGDLDSRALRTFAQFAVDIPAARLVSDSDP